MKAKKTFPVDAMKEAANKFFEESKCGDEGRFQVQMFVEKILMDTGNYHGFNYLDWCKTGLSKWETDGRPEDKKQYIGNESRIFFY